MDVQASATNPTYCHSPKLALRFVGKFSFGDRYLINEKTFVTFRGFLILFLIALPLLVLPQVVVARVTQASSMWVRTEYQAQGWSRSTFVPECRSVTPEANVLVWNFPSNTIYTRLGE